MEIKKISELFGVAAPDHAQIEVSEPSFDTPDIDPAYVFSNDQVKRLQAWWLGKVKKSLFLTGPTGCGKTTLIEQFAARVGADVFIVPCHGKLDMAEMIGHVGIANNGSTQFEYGTGVKAMQHPRPAILLLDEMNFVSPGAIGMFNRIVELKSFSIAETGEIIRPMPGLRIAATGNAVERGDDSARYRGTQTMNVALLNRFLGMRMDYMEPMLEAAMLNKAIPGLHPKLIEKLVELAQEVRHGFAQGTLEVVMSTRTLIDMGQALFGRQPLVEKNPVDEVNWAMEFCLTDLARVEDRDVVKNLVSDKFHGLKLPRAAKSTSPKPNTFKPAQTVASNAEIHLWIHPTRGPKGATFWGYVEREDNVYSTNGVVEDAAPRDGARRDQKWLTDKIDEKQKGGYIRVPDRCGISLPESTSSNAISSDVILEAVRPVIELIRDSQKGQVVSVPSHQQNFIKVALGIFP